jgi:hypothetical protein
MASMELRPHTGEATTRQRLLIPAFIHLRPSPTRFPPAFTHPVRRRVPGHPAAPGSGAGPPGGGA